jgi:hypothetical protein
MPQDQLGYAVAFKVCILKHHTRLWRNNKWPVCDDEVEFLAGNGLKKLPSANDTLSIPLSRAFIAAKFKARLLVSVAITWSA